MTGERGKSASRTTTSWSDARLVRDCLAGTEEAWSALIDKYKNLIYSIPVKYGLSSDDAADIFQAVCLELLADLPQLREPRALPKWLIQVTAHKCFQWKRQDRRFVRSDDEEEKVPPPVGHERPTDAVIAEVEQEQSLREALLELSPRCQVLIRMLFFESPARPYREVAESLGIAEGSIGFIRGRCLDRLRQRLKEKGF